MRVHRFLVLWGPGEPAIAHRRRKAAVASPYTVDGIARAITSSKNTLVPFGFGPESCRASLI